MDGWMDGWTDEIMDGWMGKIIWMDGHPSIHPSKKNILCYNIHPSIHPSIRITILKIFSVLI